MRTLLTFIKRFLRIYKRNFLRRCIAGFVGGANNYTTRLLNYLSYTPLSICKREDMDHLSLTEGFCGVCIEKGLGLLWA